MSIPNRPSFQKPTKCSSSSSSSSSPSTAGGGGGVPGGGPGGRWNGNFSAGVSPVRGLSPVRGSFHGVSRPDMERARSHNNPLFASRTSDIGRLNNTPTKAPKEYKENREKQEQWRAPTTPGKTLCTTPGKSSRTTATMRFTTPPKPVVKRKILAENREFITTGPPAGMKEEEIKQVAAAASTPPTKEVMAESISFTQSRNEDTQYGSSISPHRSRAEDSTSKPKSPLVSIEELQKRIQKFLQDEGTSAATDVSVAMSPRQSTENLRQSCENLRRSLSEESSRTGVEEAPFQPVLAPYSPRPEFLRARKSPTPAAVEGNVSPSRGEESVIQEKTTPTSTYDPKNNFLSPRPQFLRYRPLRRLELLRKSAEGTLNDLDLDSPATDADSSRMSSEKDEKEESESQDASQEAQSLKSSLEESSPRCKVSSYDLFESAEPSCEITRENTEEVISENTEEPISSLDTLEAEATLELSSPHLECEDLTQEEQECGHLELQGTEEEFEEDMNTSSSVRYLGFLAVLALVALLVVSSGSQSLLPTSLHHNHISHLWKTSKTTQPIRQFLQTTEGLWAVNPHPTDSYLRSPDILHHTGVHISSLIQSVDLSKVVETGKVLWSSGMRCSARFGRLLKGSYIHFKALLAREMDSDSKHGQEVNEWDWVPEYDFVVPRDMFDPVEAYESILARWQSWEVKSSWSSFIQAYSKFHGSKSVIQFIVDQPMSENLVSSIKSGNSSQCSLSSRPEHEVILKIHLPAPLGSLLADMQASSSQVIELNVDIAEKNEEKDIVNEGVGPGSFLTVLTVQEDPELKVVDIVTEPSTTEGVGITAGSAVDVIEEVEFLGVPTEGENPLSHGMEGLALFTPDVEKIRTSVVEDFKVAEPTSIQDPLISFQEGSHGETSGVAEACPVSFSLEETDIDLDTPLKSKPETPRSIFMERLMSTPNSWTVGAVISLFFSAAVALLVFRMSNSRSRKRRRASRKASSHRLSKSSTTEAQLKEANNVQPVEESRDNGFFVGDSSAPDQRSSENIKQFATPYPVTTGTPDRFLGKVTGEDLTPQKSLTHLFDGDTIQTLDREIEEDSSLGRYSTLVPVVRNEGTAKERVQLTPVRRSSRIRTRMQESPCNLLHSPHLCNC